MAGYDKLNERAARAEYSGGFDDHKGMCVFMGVLLLASIVWRVFF